MSAHAVPSGAHPAQRLASTALVLGAVVAALALVIVARSDVRAGRRAAGVLQPSRA